MPARPVSFPAPGWTKQDIVLFHGTTADSANKLVTGPILVSPGRKETDFGQGFTTLERQARSWADLIAFNKTTAPQVVKIVIPRDALAGLQSLVFLRGDHYDDDFWSLIHHCRTGASNHGRVQQNGYYDIENGYYDIVYGPVTVSWQQRMIAFGADQISFHTQRAQDVLNHQSQRWII